MAMKRVISEVRALYLSEKEDEKATEAAFRELELLKGDIIDAKDDPKKLKALTKAISTLRDGIK